MKTAFDPIAQAYDAQFSHTLIGTAQRNMVWHYLKASFLERKSKTKTSLKILEISCGTGEDALFFADQGHEVLATDASQEMLKVTTSKANAHCLEAKITTQQYDINHSMVDFPAASFDLIFSNFGGINCLQRERLPQLLAQCSRWLKPEGRLIWVVMGKFCWWETLYFLAKGQTKEAFRRATNEAVEASLGVPSKTLPIWYYSPRQIAREAHRYFHSCRVQAIGNFIPPSYLENFFANKSRWLKPLKWLDNITKKLSFLAYQSDHFLIDLKKQAK